MKVLLLFLSSALILLLSQGFDMKPLRRKSRRLFSLKCSGSNSEVDMISPKLNVASGFSIPIVGVEKVINMRDLASYSKNKLPASLIYRSGCVSKASESDLLFLKNELNIKTFIDLRTSTELNEDNNVKNGFYKSFLSVRGIADDKAPSQYNFFGRLLNSLFVSPRLISILNHSNSQSSTTTSSNNMDAGAPSLTVLIDSNITQTVYFIPLISQRLVALGVFKRMSFATKLKVYLSINPMLIRKHKRNQLRQLFIQQLNQGGLKLLYEIVVDFSGYQLVKVLKILAESKNHPGMVYCTAGKDRTGLVSMILLYLRGVSEGDIVEDYYASNDAYRLIDDRSATIASLKQDAGLNLREFTSAPKEAMQHVMKYIRERHGSIELYLEKYGFTKEWQYKVKEL